jgi:hypothetical protein
LTNMPRFVILQDGREVYKLELTVNGRAISKVIIDLHFKKKHRAVITTQIILALVRLLNGGTFMPISNKDSFEYFEAENLRLDGKKYRLIWLLEDHEMYIGVVNAYRR